MTLLSGFDGNLHLLAERNHYAKLATQCSNRINNIIVRFGITVGRGTSVTRNPEVRAIVEDLASDTPSFHENICPDPLPADIKTLIQQEYILYDKYVVEADSYLSRVRHKVYSMNWETRDGTIPGSEMVRILCTTPGVGEITCFTWLAFVGTPRRFPNAKALAAYCGLDPSLKVSAGKVNLRFRRSIFAVREIKEGAIVKIEDVRSIRPSNGLKPKYLNSIIGKKAKQDIPFGSPLRMEMFE